MKKWNILQVLTIGFAFLAACSDDSKSAQDNTESSEESSTGIYESVDDLPKCTEENNHKFARVGDSVYVCGGLQWRAVNAFVNGVCNLQLCNESSDGALVYESFGKKLFQCVGGDWLDEQGESFSEKEFVSCYVDALLIANVENKDDLPKCSEKINHKMAKASGVDYVCDNGSWRKLDDKVVSETDLPKCGDEGLHVFVLGKLKNYVCSEGKWFCDGTPVSSGDSTDEIAPKDTTAVERDSTKIRGVCMPVVGFSQKNKEVAWKFVNMGGTPETFLWIFDDETYSAKAVPEKSYATAGTKSATLIVNDGLPSGSGEIACSSVKIIPAPISGCECGVNRKGVIAVSEESPDSATWTIEGCSGPEPFDYEWNGVFGRGGKATAVKEFSASVSPSVKITNADGISMNVSCPSVSFEGELFGSCRIDEDWNFRLDNIYNWSNSAMGGSKARMDIVGEGYYESVTVWNGNSDYWQLVNPYEVLAPAKMFMALNSEEMEPVVDGTDESSPQSSDSNEPEEESSSSEELNDESCSSMEIESSSSEEMEMSSSADDVESSSSDEELVEESSSSEEQEPESSSSEEVISSSSNEPEEESSSSVEPEEESSSSEEMQPQRILTYSLVYNADTVCTASTMNCGPVKSLVSKNSAASWTTRSITTFEPQSYMWTFSDGQVSNSANPVMTFDKAGKVKATLTVDKGLETETTLECNPVTVDKAEITGCSCTAGLVSASNDVYENDPVKYKWTINGCRSSSAEPLSYAWSNYGENETMAVGEFSAKGRYAPTVAVTNTDGRTINVKCESVKVVDSNDPIEEIEALNPNGYGITLTAGQYVIKYCRGEEQDRYVRPSNIDVDGGMPCENYFVYGFDRYDSFGYSGRCYGFVRTQFPLYISVPNGDTLKLRSCY